MTAGSAPSTQVVISHQGCTRAFILGELKKIQQAAPPLPSPGLTSKLSQGGLGPGLCSCSPWHSSVSYGCSESCPLVAEQCQRQHSCRRAMLLSGWLILLDGAGMCSLSTSSVLLLAAASTLGVFAFWAAVVAVLSELPWLSATWGTPTIKPLAITAVWATTLSLSTTS